MPGGGSRPCFSKPAPWAVAKRIRGRFSPSPTPLPASFETIYTAIGRLACEEHYGVGRATITRWLDEAGKYRLIELRRIRVKERGIEARIGSRKAEAVRKLEAQSDTALSIPSPHVAALAADYLRAKRNGGWMISRTSDGDWLVGISVKPPALLIALAERHGFDVAAANLSDPGQMRLGCGRP